MTHRRQRTPLARLAPCAVALLLTWPALARGQAAGPAGPAQPAEVDELHELDETEEVQLGVEGSITPDSEALVPPPVLGAGLRRPGQPPPWRAAFTLGSATSHGKTYTILGALIGRQLGGGFEGYLDGQYWGGASPHLGRLAPGVNWYAPIVFRPYLGAFYARWLMGAGRPDRDALGGRAGLTIASSRRSAIGAGVAYERTLSCRTACGAWWPELSVGLRF